MRFTNEELARGTNQIVLLTLFVRDQAQQIIKGRVREWDDKSLTLVGDSEVENPLQKPDDPEPPKWATLTRLKTGETKVVAFDDIQFAGWAGW